MMGGASIPSTTGTYFFVSSSSGSNGNDGLSPSTPLATLAQAVSLCTSGLGDTILLMPGYSETISSAVAVSKNNVHIIGLGGLAALTASASNIFTITGDNCEIAGLKMAIASTKVAIVMTGADQTEIHHNVFTSAVGGAASHFIQMVTTACNFNNIYLNKFVSNLDVSGGAITQTSHITGLGIGNVIERNMFVAGRLTTANAGAVTDGVVFAAAADAGNVVRLNNFTEFNGATFTAGYETGASTVSGAAIPTENNFLLATAANAIVNTAGSAGFANNIANGTV